MIDASKFALATAAMAVLALCVAGGAAGPRDPGRPAALEVPGLTLKLDATGGVQELRLGGVCYAGGATARLEVREAPGGPWMAAPLGAPADRVSAIGATGLAFSARIEARSEYLLVTAAVEDRRRADDRAVDVVFRLPFPKALWWSSISRTVSGGLPATATQDRRPDRLPLGAAVLETVVHGDWSQNVLPVAAVTDRQQRAGLALAIPPDCPCPFRFTYQPDHELIELAFSFGLSPAASGEWKSRAPFRFLIYPVDGHWGLRDALAKYYRFFPAAFARRTRSSGLWLFNSPSLARVPDPQSYAFWEGPVLKELPLARKHAIETYPYIIVGQREIGRLKVKPARYADVAASLLEQPQQTGRTGWKWADVAGWVERCGLHDAQGRWVHRIRETPWSGNSITFPLNPSPLLTGSAERPTVAESVLGEVDAMLRKDPGLSGIYVDSLANWGSFSNYRREQFAAARTPLAHDAAGRVYIPNWMPHVDFLQALHRRIGNRLVFGNGIRPGRAFCAFACDILGVETSPYDLRERRNVDFYRAIAGAKPSLFLFYYPEKEIPPAVISEYIQRFVAIGLSPEVVAEPWGRFKSRDADLYARFLPIYRRLDLAGWQPVTRATLDNPAVWLERFGSNASERYFTLYNPGDAPATARITIQEQPASPAPRELEELVESRPFSDLRQPLTIPARCLRVIRVKR